MNQFSTSKAIYCTQLFYSKYIYDRIYKLISCCDAYCFSLHFQLVSYVTCVNKEEAAGRCLPCTMR